MVSPEKTPQNNIVDLFKSKGDESDSKHPIIDHFFNYFDPKMVYSKAEQEACFSLRHQIYSRELMHEPATHNNLETDVYDEYSHACLIQHLPSEQYAGTIRVIHPQTSEQQLPIETYYEHNQPKLTIHPGQFERGEVAELSRIAIPDLFRRRAIDCHPGSGTGVINTQSYSEVEVRCFPLIAVGLYLSAAAICRTKGITHAFAMMEADLARSAEFIGFNCEQIGEFTELHGSRAPYYINPNSMPKLRPAFYALIKEIEKSFQAKD